MKNHVGPGKKGIGVTIVNCYGDDLWKESLPPKAESFGTGTANVPTKDDVINPLGQGAYDDGYFGNLCFVDSKVVVPILETGSSYELKKSVLDLSWSWIQDKSKTEFPSKFHAESSFVLG